MQEHPLALLWLFPRPDARPDVDARQANCLVRYASELEGAGVNDMMLASVNQTLALPEDAASHLVMDGQGGTWGGAGQVAGGPGLLCVWANQQRSRGWLALASPDPDVGPRIEQRLLDDAGDLRRMRAASTRTTANSDATTPSSTGGGATRRTPNSTNRRSRSSYAKTNSSASNSSRPPTTNSLAIDGIPACIPSTTST
jgi:hypothetical protein